MVTSWFGITSQVTDSRQRKAKCWMKTNSSKKDTLLTVCLTHTNGWCYNPLSLLLLIWTLVSGKVLYSHDDWFCFNDLYLMWTNAQPKLKWAFIMRCASSRWLQHYNIYPFVYFILIHDDNPTLLCINQFLPASPYRDDLLWRELGAQCGFEAC